MEEREAGRQPSGVTYHSMVTSVDSDVVRLLGDPLRSRIVALLAFESLCVCHLVEETGAKQTNLSNHLKLLREAGLVEAEPQGRFVYYKLRPDALERVSAYFADLADAAHATRRADRKRPCPT